MRHCCEGSARLGLADKRARRLQTEMEAFSVSPSKTCRGECCGGDGLGHVVIVPTRTSYELHATQLRGGRSEGQRPSPP
jgi:hypothetical protein